jgi:acid phosphatase class B
MINKKDCIVLDLDGTTSDFRWRLQTFAERPIDWERVSRESAQDRPFEWSVMLARMARKADIEVVFLTARKERDRSMTANWLDKNIGLDRYELVMVSNDCQLPDHESKLHLLKNYVAKYYNVIFTVEDRSDVVKAYRDAGFICLQAEEYKYDLY